MIELELQCANKHKKPILSVVFDNKFVKNQKLLCHECMESYTQDARIMGFKIVNQMIQDGQKQKREFVEILIDNNQKILKQIQLSLVGLKSSSIQELDSLDEITKSWIHILDQIQLDKVAFSFFEELDKIISYGQEKVVDINKEKIINEIKEINNSWSVKFNNKLNQFNLFEDSLKCKLILQDLLIQQQDKPISSQKQYMEMLDIQYKAMKCIFNQQILNTKNEVKYLNYFKNEIIKQNPLEIQNNEFENIFSLFKEEISETEQFIILDNNQQNQNYLKIFQQDISKKLENSKGQILDMKQFYTVETRIIDTFYDPRLKKEIPKFKTEYNPRNNLNYKSFNSFNYIKFPYDKEPSFFRLDFPKQFNKIMIDQNGWIKLYKECYDLIKLEIGNSKQKIKYLDYEQNTNIQFSKNFMITDIMQKVENNIKLKYNIEFAQFGVILSKIGERCIYYYSMLIMWTYLNRNIEQKKQIIKILWQLLTEFEQL